MRIAATLLLGTCLGLSSVSGLASGDADRGRAKAVPCTACHGPTGLREAPGQPAIGGMPADYLMGAMLDFREGQRLHPYMQFLLLGMSVQDLEDIASYFASVDWESPPQSALSRYSGN